MNFSPGREDMARRHCSNAGLLKKNRIIAGRNDSILSILLCSKTEGNPASVTRDIHIANEPRGRIDLALFDYYQCGSAKPVQHSA